MHFQQKYKDFRLKLHAILTEILLFKSKINVISGKTVLPQFFSVLPQILSIIPQFFFQDFFFL
jgi:hypothetical protein